MSRRSLLKAFGWALPGITVLEGLRRAGANLGVESEAGHRQDDESTFFRKGWERDLGTYRLPDWFTSNRVQAHTGLSLKWLERREFSQAPGIVADLGARVLTRYVKTGEEDPWWPTATMVSANRNSRADQALLVRGAVVQQDLVLRMIQDTHAQGLRFIAYYWHMADSTANRLHPEWVCRRPGGGTLRHRRGEYLDITSAYREVILERLLELGALGVDGIYFDNRHVPNDGCWGTALANGFRDETGSDPPRRADENDPLYRCFLDYQAYRVEETFAYWRREVHARYPELVFIISTAVVPALVNRRTTSNLVRLADSSKSEFHHALSPQFNLRTSRQNRGVPEPRKDIRIALGWTLLRDSAEGRPPHIWAPGFVTPRETLAATAAVLTYGGIMNVNIYETDLTRTQPRGVEKRDSAADAFALGNLVSPYLKDTTPLRWAAVHWSELARNRRHGDLARVWREIVWPVNGAFAEFVEHGVPVGTVDDFQLENDRLDDYRLLFLPTPRELTEQQLATVEKFRSAGGIVVEQDPTWSWHDPSQQSAIGRALRGLIEPHLPTAPLQVEIPEANIHSGIFRHDVAGRIVVLVTNDFSWVRTERGAAQRPRDEVAPPRPVSGVNLLVRSQQPPRRIHDVLAKTDLDFDLVSGRAHVRVPTFPVLAVVSIDLG